MAAETRTLQTKVTWVVGLFPESNEYSVIPSNWIVKNDTQSNVLFCKWPGYRVTSEHLQKAENPSPSWESYRVKIIGGNKTYDNFNKAWHKQVKEKYSSTDTDESVVKSKKKMLVYSSSDNESDDDGSVVNIMQPIIKIRPTTATTQGNLNFGTSSSETNVNNQPNHIRPTPVTDNFCNYSSSSNSFFEETAENKREILQYTEMTSVQSHNSFQNSSSLQVTSNFEDKLNYIIKEQIGIKLMLNRILSKIEENQSNNYKKTAELDEIFLSQFPICDDKRFASINYSILNEPGFVSKLEYFITTIGGNNAKNHINRVMAKLFSDEYGIRCTWTGRGKNIITKIGDSELIRIMKKAVQESCTTITVTDSEFEKVVSEWLRHANTRFTYKTKNLGRHC